MRARACFESCGRPKPSTSSSPSSQITCAVSAFMVVDLPAPFGPSRPTHWPNGTSRSSPSTAVIDPNRFTIPRSLMAGSVLMPGMIADDVAMAYDEDLAHRIRELLADERGVIEQRMFGGLAFLIGGNMSVAASGRGGLLVRVDPDDSGALLDKPHVSVMEMRGRLMKGWLRVGDEGVRTKRQLQPWVRRGVAYARSWPAKKK